MTHEQAMHTVAMLQADPLYYRNFGAYWWHIKDELKRHGFGPEHLEHLGIYDDPNARQFYEGERPGALTAQAFEHQADHTVVRRNGNQHQHDFGPYRIYDGDAE